MTLSCKPTRYQAKPFKAIIILHCVLDIVVDVSLVRTHSGTHQHTHKHADAYIGGLYWPLPTGEDTVKYNESPDRPGHTPDYFAHFDARKGKILV